MRIKAVGRGTFNPNTATADEFAQAARDTLTMRVRLTDKPEHLALLGNVYAQLANYEILHEVRDLLHNQAAIRRGSSGA